MARGCFVLTIRIVVLITGYPFIIEVTRDGEIVWQLQYTDMESVVEGPDEGSRGSLRNRWLAKC
jgi:hypothetical protein